jgi:ADP-ribose pyrophosphatase
MSFELLKEQTLFSGRIFDLVQAHFRLPNGREQTFDLVKHHGAVVLVPVDQQGNILFVSQFRIGAGKELLELPAGLLEEGELPEQSAMREIREETGMASEKLTRLGEFFMVPGYSTEKMQVYLATGLTESSLPTDEDEFLELVAIPIIEVYQMAYEGKIFDGKTLAALLMAQPFLKPI